jgi:integral membrane protein (TIGR01906 family)
MPSRITKTLNLFLALLISILVITTAVRLLATDQYLVFEYSKASFPSDPYGFTNQQRFILASTNIHYVGAHLPDDELSKQTLNGTPIYNPREISHMIDVRAVFQSIFQVWQAAFILALVFGFILWRKGELKLLSSAIQSGGLLTSGFILSIGLLAVFAWQFWFDTFHLLFFKPGSWLFSYSDTLIRLFPVEFWFDATLTISVLSLFGGLIIALIGWRWRIIIEKAAHQKIPL